MKISVCQKWVHIEGTCCIRHKFITHTEGSSESERCLEDGRSASHEITKQIKTHRLPSLNILSGCVDMQISWMCA